MSAFKKHGYTLDHVNGSHHIMKKTGSATLSIPVHGNETVGKGLLKSQIEAAGLTVEEFTKLLK